MRDRLAKAGEGAKSGAGPTPPNQDGHQEPTRDEDDPNVAETKTERTDGEEGIGHLGRAPSLPCPRAIAAGSLTRPLAGYADP